VNCSRVYRKGVLDGEGFPIADVSEHLERDDTMVWFDLCRPTKEEIDQLAVELGLHELAVEDVLEPHQRPKLDQYETHLFLTCHATGYDQESATFHKTEIDAFIGTRWLITVRDDDEFSMERVKNRWDRSPELAASGVSFLVYGLLDTVVDTYFSTVEALDNYYDDVSERLFQEHPLAPTEQQQWFNARRALMTFRRLALPMREMISGVMRKDRLAVDEAMSPYFQDVRDHVLHVTETTDALRDLVSTLVETNIALRDYRANQIMKRVTSWAAIIAVPTLITGWYGMNVPYPGAQDRGGVIAAAVLVVVLSAVLYVVFHKKGWL